MQSEAEINQASAQIKSSILFIRQYCCWLYQSTYTSHFPLLSIIEWHYNCCRMLSPVLLRSLGTSSNWSTPNPDAIIGSLLTTSLPKISHIILPFRGIVSETSASKACFQSVANFFLNSMLFLQTICLLSTTVLWPTDLKLSAIM